MGSIKNIDIGTPDANGTMTYTLTEGEFNYAMNVNAAKQGVMNEYNRVLSAFLHYVSSSRLGYDSNEELQYELDFSNKKRELKITRVLK